MNELVARLQSLKANLPANCTRANVIKLHSRFLEYQLLVARIEMPHEQLQQMHKNNIGILKLKIGLIDFQGDSLKLTRHYFKDAIHYMQQDLDKLITALNTVQG